MDRLPLPRWPTLVLAAATLATLFATPAEAFLQPTRAPTLGVLGFLATVAFLAAERLRGHRGRRVERLWLTLFLPAMPVVYLLGLAGEATGRGSWAVEQGGLALFALLAALAVAHSWRWLPLGIALHGLWDLGHLLHPAAVPPWYALVCFLIDGAMAVWVAAEVGAWPRGLAPRPRTAESA